MKPAHLLAAVILSFGTASSAMAECAEGVAPDLNTLGPGVNWKFCVLSPGTNLSGQVMTSMILNNTILEDVKFIRTDLRGAKLRHARLRWSDMTDADLNQANLTKANLTGATLIRANLWKAILVGTIFDGADLSGATWVDGRECATPSIGQCN